MKRSLILSTLEALSDDFLAQFVTKPPFQFHWSFSTGPIPWVKLNHQYICRVALFDDLEDPRKEGFLGYTTDTLYIGSIQIAPFQYWPGGNHTMMVTFHVAATEEAGRLDAKDEFDLHETQTLSLLEEGRHDICAECCKMNRGKCKGKCGQELIWRQGEAYPDCFEYCDPEAECPYDPEACAACMQNLPDEAMRIWEEAMAAERAGEPQ